MPSSKVYGMLMILVPLDLNFFFFFLEWAQNLGYNMALWIIFHLLFEFLFSKFFLFSFFRKLFPLFFIKKKKSSLEKKKFTEDFFFNSFP